MPLPRIQGLIVKELNALGHLTAGDIDTLNKIPHETSGVALEQMLHDDYKLTSMQILIAKSKVFNMNPFICKRFRVSNRTFQLLDESFCVEHEIVPIGTVGKYFVIADANPFDLDVAKTIEAQIRRPVKVLLALRQDIQNLLKINRQEAPGHNFEADFQNVMESLGEDFRVDTTALRKSAVDVEESAPVIQLANRIVEEAFFSDASDIHIEPTENECRVRFRIDGVCRNRLTFAKSLSAVLVTRFKVMANLDIAEKRLPQDGRIRFKEFTKKAIDIDLRISTAPLNHGEGLVMRILDKQKSLCTLSELGFEPSNLEQYMEVIRKPYGMILHCGPTGSGKSMTLYSALNVINNAECVIRTAEDPVEYTQPGLCQMQVNPKIGLTFASALRAFLRQDPDVILVGEIRDTETAAIALEASLTGHLLFSTLHTNDASSAVARLIELGMEPFMISAALLCICAQRLIRRSCSHCHEIKDPTAREQEILQNAIGWVGPIPYVKQDGCAHCNRTSYNGRIGIHELIVVNSGIANAINNRTDTHTLKNIALQQGMRTLHQDSMFKVKKRTTTMAEAITIVAPDRD